MAVNITTPEMEVAKILLLIQTSICLTIVSFLFLLQIWGILEIKHGFSFRTTSSRGKIWLLLAAFDSIVYYSLVLTMTVPIWTKNTMELECRYLTAPAVPLTYVIQKQFLYYFLLERARVVHDSMRLDNRYFLLLRKVLQFFIIFGVQAIYSWSFFLAFDGIIYPNGCCVLFSHQETIVIIFCVSDFILSLCLLFLFIYPLYFHLKLSSFNLDDTGNQNKKKLIKVMKRNLRISLVITTSTFGSLTASCVVNVLHTNANNLDKTSHLQMYSVFFPGIDLAICISAALLINSSWMPKRVAERFFKKETSGTPQPPHIPQLMNNNVVDDEKRNQVDEIPSGTQIIASNPLLASSENET